MPWDPDLYRRFEAERFAPFDDLARLVVVRPGMRVVDLGCGTGELTRRLADGLPGSDVVGIDSSGEMLEKAAAHARPGLRFQKATIEEVAGSWDLVFSHAAIQWVDDHASLVPRLFGLVGPGGQLAVQLPSNHGHPTHLLLSETADEDPFRAALSGFTRGSPVLSIEQYLDLLHRAGGESLTVLEKVYPHVVDGADALALWNRGTAMVPYFERLPTALHEPFFERYRDKLRRRFPGSPLLYGFRRTLFAASRPIA